MASPQGQNVRIQTDPELKDAFNYLKKEILLNLNCHHVGQVESVNTGNQTLTAQVMYKKTYLQKDIQGVYKTVLVDYPLILDVPFVVIGGGTGSLRMPIKKGDECLLLFNDRAIDNWFSSGQIVELSSSRLHSFSDAIALVGIRSLKNSIEDYDPDAVELKNEEGSISIKENKIAIENATRNLLTVLTLLVDDLINLQTTNAVVGNPSALSPATISNLNTVKTQLQELLA